MFNPGETVEQRFVLPFDNSDLSKVIVTYKNNGDVFHMKSITSADIEPEDNKTIIHSHLSQEETLLFKPNCSYKIQINVTTRSGSRFASKEITDKTGAQHYWEVIPYGGQ